jgi:hypothetical protein
VTAPSCAPLDDAIADELAHLRAERARLIKMLRTERACGATVVRIPAILHALGAS